jgi:hypothetical protein
MSNLIDYKTKEEIANRINFDLLSLINEEYYGFADWVSNDEKDLDLTINKIKFNEIPNIIDNNETYLLQNYNNDFLGFLHGFSNPNNNPNEKNTKVVMNMI